MRLLFIASGAFAIPTLKWCVNSPHEIVQVVTQPARGKGRGRHVTRTPVAAEAAKFDLPVIEAENINEPDTLAHLRSLNADLGLVIAFGQKLRNDLLAMMPGGCINLHASLLPKYRGAAPINWAIVNGEETTGCTVFRIVERMDAGPILSSRWTQIKPEEIAGELHDRLAGIGVDAVDAALKLFADGANPAGEPQNDSLSTTARKLEKSDGWIRFDRPARQIANLIHGMTPWPGATAMYQSSEERWESVSILRARVSESLPTSKQAPGTLDSQLRVTTSEGLLEILEIKPSSGRVMTWPEYVNGRHVKAGDKLMTPE